MKTVLVTLLLFAATVARGQTGYNYSTLADCDNDPLKYIERNYEFNGGKYIGKTIGFWADECEIHLEEVIPAKFSPWERDKSLIGKIELVSFPVTYSGYKYSVYLFIDAPYTLTWQDAIDLEKDEDLVWGKKLYDFYRNEKIKSIYIYKSKDGHKLHNYHRR